MKKQVFFTLLILPIVCLFVSCHHGEVIETKAKWYKGNTHTHTKICGHADSTPEHVTKWYHDRNYNFLILSEHNHFIDPKTVKMPEPCRNDFILIPGEEITEKVHSTAMNIDGIVPITIEKMTVRENIQSHVHRAMKKGGHLILNHPNFHWRVKQEDMLDIENLYMFELYNGHPSVNNFGNDKHHSTEEIWDYLLSRKMKIFGVSSDDAHHFHKKNLKESKSNPGRGWVMVNAEQLSPKSITNAMVQGNFYSSSGVMLNICERNHGKYMIGIDDIATKKEVSSTYIFGHKNKEAKPGYKIEWIGKDGKVLKTVNQQLTSTYIGKTEEMYIRPKVTFTAINKKNELVEFYAWGQPMFMDGR